MALPIFLSCPNIFHLGKEENWRPFRSLEDFAVGWGRTEPWAPEHEERDWGRTEDSALQRDAQKDGAHSSSLSLSVLTLHMHATSS